MSQGGKILTGDFHACQKSRQQNIKTGGFMEKTACRHTHNLYIADARKECHGTWKNRGTIQQIGAACIHQTLPGYVIGIHG